MLSLPGPFTCWTRAQPPLGGKYFLKAAPNNRTAIFEGLAHSFLKGTLWHPWRFSDMKGIRYKDLSQMADYLQKHPFGKTLLSLFRGSAITPEERWGMALASKSEAARLFSVVINLAVKDSHSRKLFFPHPEPWPAGSRRSCRLGLPGSVRPPVAPPSHEPDDPHRVALRAGTVSPNRSSEVCKRQSEKACRLRAPWGRCSMFPKEKSWRDIR